MQVVICIEGKLGRRGLIESTSRPEIPRSPNWVFSWFRLHDCGVNCDRHFKVLLSLPAFQSGKAASLLCLVEVLDNVIAGQQ
jgi:hypothetical protein